MKAVGFALVAPDLCYSCPGVVHICSDYCLVGRYDIAKASLIGKWGVGRVFVELDGVARFRGVVRL